MEGMNNLREKFVIGFLVLLLIGGGVWRAVQTSSPGGELALAGQNQQSFTDDDSVVEPEMITVHLVGAVNEPGVYQLPAGSRVFELLKIGGGFSEDAEQEVLNQARPLFDGEQVYIHRTGETERSPSMSDGGGKININQASASELTALPGIGDVRANQIIAHRETNGFFTDLEQIMDVSGIGQATFNNIADQITIY
ncbi:MAG: helix-hairpin-helix domain-containing protein [Bacillota bacterium]